MDMRIEKKGRGFHESWTSSWSLFSASTTEIIAYTQPIGYQPRHKQRSFPYFLEVTFPNNLWFHDVQRFVTWRNFRCISSAKVSFSRSVIKFSIAFPNSEHWSHNHNSLAGCDMARKSSYYKWSKEIKYSNYYDLLC